jgi:hypothetical protein
MTMTNTQYVAFVHSVYIPIDMIAIKAACNKHAYDACLMARLERKFGYDKAALIMRVRKQAGI